jgi:hypothetical protein
MNTELIALAVVTVAWATTTIMLKVQVDRQATRIKTLAKIVDASVDLLGQAIAIISAADLIAKGDIKAFNKANAKKAASAKGDN